MHVIQARNVNDAFVDGLWWLKVAGIEEDSRNGPVIVSPTPVTTIYHRPTQRVLLDPIRDCNPFFHLFEAVWMLSGLQKVDPLLEFNKNMGRYAEDDGTIYGAYGHRWRTQFGVDQLLQIVGILGKDSTSRQAVLQMWHSALDLGTTVRDKPCNTHCYFRINAGCLDMTVCCRSNDLVWGAYGANAVHFSILQEVIANTLSIPVGKMYQISNNFHIYRSVPRFNELMSAPCLDVNPYSILMSELDFILTPNENLEQFLRDCFHVVCGIPAKISNSWLRRLVVPMIQLWRTRDRAILQDMDDCDWKLAFTLWLNRRQENVSK